MPNDDIESSTEVQIEISWPEFVRLSGFSEPEITELIEFGLLTPATHKVPYAFDTTSLQITRHAYRLKNDFELQPLALDLVFDLLTKIERLEQELITLRTRQTLQAPNSST